MDIFSKLAYILSNLKPSHCFKERLQNHRLHFGVWIVQIPDRFRHYRSVYKKGQVVIEKFKNTSSSGVIALSPDDLKCVSDLER